MEHVPPSTIFFRIDHPAFLDNFLGLATQMAEAIAYLRDIIHIAHIDIKPENIMYTFSSSGEDIHKTRNSKNINRNSNRTDNTSSSEVLWKLCDFGLMKPFSSDGSPGDFKGTTMYMPPNLRTQRPKFSGMNVMVYQYACILLETLVSGMDYHQISPSWNAGRDLDWGRFYFETFLPFLRSDPQASFLVGKIPFLKNFTSFFYKVFHPKTLALYVDTQSKFLEREFAHMHSLLLLRQARADLHGN